MIEYLPSFLLLCLLISAVFLIRLLLELPVSLTTKTEVIGSELKDITDILDEIAGYIDSVGELANQAIPQTANSPMESILNGLISSVMAPKTHGSPDTQRTVQEINITPQVETEN